MIEPWRSAQRPATQGYDASKKVTGTKRHIAVDTQGLPHAIGAATGGFHDRSGALLMFLANDDRLCEEVPE